MNSDRRPVRIIAATALALLLGACADQSTAVGRIDPADFGEANRQTYAAMIIDPDPVYDTDLPTSAEHAAEAVERYRAGQVKQPDRVSSTSVRSSGSSGGGSGSGPN